MTNQIDERNLIDVLRELGAVERDLLATADDAFALRQDLHDREAALREELRAIGSGRADNLSIEQLERRIAVVEQGIKDHYGLRMSHATRAARPKSGQGDPPTLGARARRGVSLGMTACGLRKL